MLFDWNADTIRWYSDAEAYSGFYKKIAGMIIPGLREYQTLCDLGCGPGLFSFEAAPYFDSVECVDLSEKALRSIKERAAQQGFKNISTRLEDAYQLAGTWDVIFMSFFGSRELDRFLSMCRKLIAVVSDTSESELFPMKEQRFKKNTADETARYLKGKGIQYRLTHRNLEFGQPFKSLEDARRCIRYYVPDLTNSELDSCLNTRLEETRGEVWPYYLPRMKSVGIFELDGTLG
jgi:SAM-dependent methyltransferase